MDLLEIERGSEPRTLTLVGELDASNAPSLANALAAQHEEPGDVQLDVSRLTFLDSVGLGAIIAAAKRLEQGNLVLVSPTAAVSRVLQLSGVVSALPNLVVEGNPAR